MFHRWLKSGVLAFGPEFQALVSFHLHRTEIETVRGKEEEVKPKIQRLAIRSLQLSLQAVVP